MSFKEDPRIRTGRRNLLFSWVYYALYLAAAMGLAYTLGNSPYIFGLPRWVAVSCLAVPLVFVIALIFLVEKLIPDIPLSDESDEDKT